MMTDHKPPANGPLAAKPKPAPPLKDTPIGERYNALIAANLEQERDMILRRWSGRAHLGG